MVEIPSLRRLFQNAYPGLWNEVFVVIALILLALAAFGLGRLSMALEQKETLKIVYPNEDASVLQDQTERAGSRGGIVQGIAAAGADGAYVASKIGSKYHLPWCAGAQAIKEENKVWFETKEAAEAAGYTPAANCKGL